MNARASRRRSSRFVIHVAACLVGALAFAGVVGAQSGGIYEIVASTVDGGGGRVAGAGFLLEGTIGQHDAGTAQQGGAFELTGGFQHASINGGDALFGDGFEGP